MKKLFKIATLSLVVLLATGCGMKEEFGIKIGKDKDVELEFLVAQDDEFIDAMLDTNTSWSMDDENSSTEQKTHTDKERWEYLESDANEDDSFKDYEKAKYDKDGYKGYTYSLKLGKIDDLVTDSKDAVAVDSIGKDSKLFTKDGNVYKLNLKLSNEELSQMQQYKDQVDFDVKIKVTLPNKAKSNNATKVDGNTYIWDLTKAKSVDLSFEITGKDSSSNTIILIAGGACAVLAIGIGVVALTKKKKPVEQA